MSPPGRAPALRLAIVDDEPLARMRLRLLIEAMPDLGIAIVGEAGSTDAALVLLQSTPADAVLLDIGMPGLRPDDGLRLAAALNALAPRPALIFVTAHAEHALRAFELQAVDYLTKPVRAERLHDALLRVRQRLRFAAEPAVDGPVLVVSERGRVLRLPVAEVLVLQAAQKTVTLRTGLHSHVLDETLSELHERLAKLGGAFIRIHRNALVARHAVRALELRPDAGGDAADGWAVRVAPHGEWLVVSRRQIAAVRAALADGDAATPQA